MGVTEQLGLWHNWLVMLARQWLWDGLAVVLELSLVVQAAQTNELMPHGLEISRADFMTRFTQYLVWSSDADSNKQT